VTKTSGVLQVAKTNSDIMAGLDRERSRRIRIMLMKKNLLATALVFAVISLFLPAIAGARGVSTGAKFVQANNGAAVGNTEGSAPVALQAGTSNSQPKVYKVDSQELFLLPGEGIEIKILHAQGRSDALFLECRRQASI
jgi:hypothetical protein